VAAIGFGNLIPGAKSSNYTIHVTNFGGAPASLYVASPNLPEGISLIVYNGLGIYTQGSTIAPSETKTLKVQLSADTTITVNIPQTNFSIVCSEET
jgi:hypothetical protein